MKGTGMKYWRKEERIKSYERENEINETEEWR
jgi:hypothetical protein